MNRSKIIIVFIVCAIVFTFTEIFGKDAAKFRIVKTIQITNDGEYYMDPKLSPDGSMVVFKGRKGGLFIRNADRTGSMVTILAKKGMYKYIWSPDSKQIAFDVFTSEKGRKKMELHIYDIHSNTSSMIRDKGRPFRLTQWTNEGIEVKRKIKIENQKKGLKTVKERFNIHFGSFELKKSPLVYFEQSDNRNYIIVDDGNSNILLKKPNYVLPLLSPKNDRLLTAVYRDGHTHILDISGSIVGDLGMADEEQWSPDGKYIIYEIPEYGGRDGQAMVASEIYIINADGTGKNKLTDTENIIERKGQCSDGCQKITYFDQITGKIFVSELEYDE
ncbi:MAG: hypothetical protein GWP19_06225 [Planctomycetia bacterium]|nr:hypothetical protein [Planctomycetia bacterium]